MSFPELYLGVYHPITPPRRSIRDITDFDNPNSNIGLSRESSSRKRERDLDEAIDTKASGWMLYGLMSAAMNIGERCQFIPKQVLRVADRFLVLGVQKLRNKVATTLELHNETYRGSPLHDDGILDESKPDDIEPRAIITRPFGAINAMATIGPKDAISISLGSSDSISQVVDHPVFAVFGTHKVLRFSDVVFVDVEHIAHETDRPCEQLTDGLIFHAPMPLDRDDSLRFVIGDKSQDIVHTSSPSCILVLRTRYGGDGPTTSYATVENMNIIQMVGSICVPVGVLQSFLVALDKHLMMIMLASYSFASPRVSPTKHPPS